MNVKYTLVMVGLAGIGLRAVVGVISRRDVVLVLVCVGGNSMVTEINVRLHHVDGCPMLQVNFVRMRLRGTSRAGPHERGGQKDRNELTREGHLALD